VRTTSAALSVVTPLPTEHSWTDTWPHTKLAENRYSVLNL